MLTADLMPYPVYRYSYAMGWSKYRWAMLPLLLTAPSAHAQNAPRWSYGENEDKWGQVSKKFAACDTGMQQSPINIAFTDTSNQPALELHYAESGVELRYTDWTLEIRFTDKKKPTLTEAGHSWQLQRILFHAPSEHKIRGDFHIGEIEFMHEDAAGKQLILSVFADEGAAIAAMDPLLAHVVDIPGKYYATRFDPSTLLPDSLGYYAYTGSLTFPPCTEGVEWRVLKTPVTLTHDQLSAITRLTQRNARPVQPIYMRTVRESQ